MGLQTIVSTNENSDDSLSSVASFDQDPSFAHDNDELHKGAGDDVATTLSSLPHAMDDDDPIDDDPYEDEFNNSAKGSSSRSDKNAQDDSDEPKIAEGEARAVVASKFLVAIVLVLSAALLGYISYEYTRQEEVNEFHTKFLDFADEIARSGVNNARNSFTVLQSFSRTVTSLANYGNETWPFMSLPDFEVRAHDYQIISGAEEVAFAPIVEDHSREAFEQYTDNHQDWIQRGLDYEYLVAINTQQEQEKEQQDNTDNNEDGTNTIAPGTNMEGFSIINKAKPIQPFIWKHAPQTNRAIPETNRGPHVPIWQTYPAPRNSYVVNHNLRSVPAFEHLIATAITNRTTVLSDVVDNFALFGRAQTIDLDPKSIVVQPIFQHSSHTNIDGFLIVIKKWDMYFQNVLYKGAQPLICVLKNSCGKAFSYKITGPRAEFLGEGDLHDPTYDDMVVVEEFAHEQVASACQFWFEVYPTRSMEQASKTNMPLYVTFIVMGVFGFTTLVFMLYDYLVSRRQQTTMASANATNRIVSNLFPKAVRDRLIQEMELQDHNQHEAEQHQNHNNFTNADHNANSAHPHKKKKNKRMSSIRQSITPFSTRSSTAGNSGAFLNISVHSNHSGSDRRGGGCGTSEDIFGSKPIAELFPATTIMFADMVGFTAWSSVRDPTQVFTLLETIYHAFDTIAKRRRVFKVETIGDCYVAVAGLPMPRKDHAIVMARFSSECLAKMDLLTKNLEATLGPDTGDLSLRIGLHSGPVTAGVLRGEKGRFQLFGDTMNTASRMESTGTRSKIQVSRETAHLLKTSGKEKWVTEREEKVNAKGKGELQTFWLQIKAASDNNDGASVISSTSQGDHSGNFSSSAPQSHSKNKREQLARMASTREATNMLQEMASAAKSRRLIEWNAEILGKLLKQIVLRRVSRKIKKRQLGILGGSTPKESKDQADTTFEMVSPSGPAIDEVQDIISLPHFDQKNFARNVDPDSVAIPETVLVQLNLYVSRIADLYQDNPFHSFEHASHVTMSVTKLMSRIVNPLQVDGATGEQNRILHDHTFGITSDPLTQFACVLSALIHDADHPGVGNSVLVKEKDPLALKYNNKSVAEQNSVDLAWNILMEDTYEDLRALIYTNAEEFKRFRQIIVNVVLATDIMDKELGALRKTRWDKAFNTLTNNSSHYSTASSLNGSANFRNEDTSSSEQEAQYDVNRKATIVLEHLIQASDVSHTMQHWHVYRKWNERLFQEVYQAYLDGRIDTNPADGWYKGEIGFFDFYIIPLAKKLETCGVFGVSSHEYLGYAEGNRREWEEKGESIVKDYLAKYQPAEQAPEAAIGE